MDSISIGTNKKRIAIDGDESRVITFDPSDIAFAQRFYDLIGKFQSRLAEYRKRSDELEAATGVDEFGLPANAGERLALLREACEYIRAEIDILFGAGTSQTAFGDSMDPDAYTEFFEGLTPFIQAARRKKVDQYSGKKHPKRAAI